MLIPMGLNIVAGFPSYREVCHMSGMPGQGLPALRTSLLGRCAC